MNVESGYTYEHTLRNLTDNAAYEQRDVRALSAFLKSGRAKKFIDPSRRLIGNDLRVQFFGGGRTLYIDVQVANLEGFKDQRLAGILTMFEYMNPDSTSIQEYPSSFTKEVVYIYEDSVESDNGHRARIRVAISARIKTDSVTCRRVQVGVTAPEPQPIYKMVCDEDTAAAAATTTEVTE